ncbi:MAG: GTPase HflX, partial [Fimbriimonadaceae bacterium]|nr:GTPase HflX [Alphaproteobacteria bacterium]
MRQDRDTDKQTQRAQTEGFSLHSRHGSERSERTRILIVCPVLAHSPSARDVGSLHSRPGGSSTPFRDERARREEAVGLAQAIDLNIINTVPVQLKRARPSTLIGSGKVAEIKSLVESGEIEMVFVDAVLSPVQQRNLEREWSCKILDRTGLILEIFGARAHTREGRLQVELAHLQYQKSRLVRSWTHLERQRGGFGFLGGPGETQIEADKRLIQERISKIEHLLAKVRRTRALHRGSRKRVPYPVIALVGYTNAGKSTLFNRLTDASVDAKDLLFATLDPTLRAVELPGGRDVILSDTVGFVSDLPHELVAAFRSTLEEVIEADLIIHVRDISHADSDAQARDVADVLQEIGISTSDETDATPLIEAWNKADLLE